MKIDSMSDAEEIQRLRALEADLRAMMVRCGLHKGDSEWLDNGSLFCEVLTLLDRHNVLPEQEVGKIPQPSGVVDP